MASYSEEKDLIQNVKELMRLMDTFREEVEPSVEEVLSLKEQFESLESKTVSVINKYQSSMDDKSQELEDLLTECRSQVSQVTNDVESLVNLQVNFTEIKEDIETCLEVYDNLSTCVIGIQLMDDTNYVAIADRRTDRYYDYMTDTISNSVTVVSGSAGASGAAYDVATEEDIAGIFS